MTTLAEAIDASLDANWSGAGGTEPTISNTQNVIGEYFPATDYILVLGYTLRTTMRAVNDVYAHKIHTIDLECSTSDATNTEDRLNEIVEEAERILQTDAAVTGYDAVRVIRDDRSITPRDRHVYKALVTVELQEYLAASATASGAGTTYTLGQALMLGSANAAWVPCIYNGYSATALVSLLRGEWSPATTGTKYLNFLVPLPTLKGTLKLYIGDLKIDCMSGLDANNYISEIILYGFKMSTSTNTAVFTDPTDYTTNATVTWTNAADDMSSYDFAHVLLSTSNAATTLKISNLLVSCYYAT